MSVKGVHVDSITGALVPVQSVIDCEQFGYQFKLPLEVGPYLRVHESWSEAAERIRPEIGLLRVTASHDIDTTQNTLVVYVGERWNDEAAAVIIAGVDECRRRFAGLLVLLLFRDGALNDNRLTDKITDLTAALAAPALVAEDVHARWSEYLSLSDSTAAPDWRLMNPAGTVVWAHDGDLNEQELAAVLDEHLAASRPAEPLQLRGGMRIGDRISIDLMDGDCPPVTLQRPRTAGSRVAFLDTGAASTAAMRTLAQTRQDADEPPWVAVVVDGASKDDIGRLTAEFGLSIPVFADPDGGITRSAGVLFTPCLLTLDPHGTLMALETEPVSAGNQRITTD